VRHAEVRAALHRRDRRRRHARQARRGVPHRVQRDQAPRSTGLEPAQGDAPRPGQPDRPDISNHRKPANSLTRDILTQPIVVLDSDPAGKNDVDRLLADGVIEQTAVVQVVRPSCAHSELEDVLIQDSYLAALETRIVFSLNDRQKRKLDQGRDTAWSERLSEILVNAGVPGAEKLVTSCKYDVTQAAISAVEQG